MAQDRVAALTGRPSFMPPALTREEREEALKDAASAACQFCAAFHPGASTAACPRLATFKLNGDGTVIEGSFWPSGQSDWAVELDGEGKVRTMTHHEHSDWDTSQVVRVADAAEEEPERGGEEETADDDA